MSWASALGLREGTFGSQPTTFLMHGNSKWNPTRQVWITLAGTVGIFFETALGGRFDETGSNTSRKHGEKNRNHYFHCGSFDHHALQSLNNCRFVFLGLPDDNLGNLGLVTYRLEWSSKYLSYGISHAPKILI